MGCCECGEWTCKCQTPRFLYRWPKYRWWRPDKTGEYDDTDLRKGNLVKLGIIVSYNDKGEGAYAQVAVTQNEITRSGPSLRALYRVKIRNARNMVYDILFNAKERASRRALTHPPLSLPPP